MWVPVTQALKRSPRPRRRPVPVTSLPTALPSRQGSPGLRSALPVSYKRSEAFRSHFLLAGC